MRSLAVTAVKMRPAFDAGTSPDMLKRDASSAAMLDYWDKTDAIIGGIKTMRAAGEAYLPRFTDETQDAYNYRLKTTKMTNVYRDIVESLASKPFEEDIKLGDDATSEFEQFAEDVDGAGNNLTVFASSTFFNGINSAIDWIFVDFPKMDSTIRTVADAKARGIRPFWSHVLARNVLQAKVKVISGRETLTYIRILEPGSPDHVREFERMEGGQVVWRLWRKRDQQTTMNAEFDLDGEGTVSIGIIPMVPFITGRRDGRTFKFDPTLQDAADLQIELYQQESGLKFAKTLTAYPMLTANGVRPQMMPDGKTPVPVAVGPNKTLYAPPDGNGTIGSWAYIEPSATSLKFLADDIKDTIQNLRELGKQPLTATSGNLTVITTAVAAGKAKSAVGAWAGGLKDALENALKITALWLSQTDGPEVVVYDEFDNFTEDGSDLEHLRAMRKEGDLSQETYWRETKRRRVLAEDFDADEERKRLLDEMNGEEDEIDVDIPPNNSILPPTTDPDV